MKSTYNSPKLIQHGNVEEITQAVGQLRMADTVFLNDTPLNLGTLGSTDANIHPCSGSSCTQNTGVNNRSN